MQNILMKFDPATGEERPYPSHAAQWRNWHGVAAWLFDPWTGKRRNAYDVGSDVHGLLIVPAGTLGGDTGCGASKQNKHEAGNDAQWPEPLWWEVSMDDNYCTPLAAILRKAQGCIYRGTDEFIDVGGEVSELRRICDNQRATISRLREYAKHRYTCHIGHYNPRTGKDYSCNCGYDALMAEVEEGK